jgi:hypothetical protein
MSKLRRPKISTIPPSEQLQKQRVALKQKEIAQLEEIYSKARQWH